VRVAELVHLAVVVSSKTLDGRMGGLDTARGSSWREENASAPPHNCQPARRPRSKRTRGGRRKATCGSDRVGRAARGSGSGSSSTRVPTGVTPCRAPAGPAPRPQSPRRRLPIPGGAAQHFLALPRCRFPCTTFVPVLARRCVLRAEHGLARPTQEPNPRRCAPCHLPPLLAVVHSSARFSFTFYAGRRGRRKRNDG
jgi:hypothetical protein